MKNIYTKILTLTLGLVFSCFTVQASLKEKEEVEVEKIPTAVQSFVTLVEDLHKQKEASVAYDTLMSEAFSDNKFWSFSFVNRLGYSNGAYHKGFGDREKFVTLSGKPLIKVTKNQIRVTWNREFDGKKSPRLFAFDYRSLIKKEMDEKKENVKSEKKEQKKKKDEK